MISAKSDKGEGVFPIDCIPHSESMDLSPEETD